MPSTRGPTRAVSRFGSFVPANRSRTRTSESFSTASLRDECLNEHWFISLADAKAAIKSVARRLQHRPAAQLAGWANARSICQGLCGGSPAIAGSP